MDEIITHGGWVWKVQNFIFCHFWQLKNLSHTQTFKYMSRINYHRTFFFWGEMLITMSSIRINNNWNYQKTANYSHMVPIRCISAAKHQTAEQYSKTGRTKPQKHPPRSDLSWNTCQDFLKIPSLWEPALEAQRRCFSKVILESNVTPNITRSDSFSTVLIIVNGGGRGCIVHDLEISTLFCFWSTLL